MEPGAPRPDRADFMILWLFPLLSVVLKFKDDSALVRRRRERDPAAMSDLYDRYGRIAYSLILRVVNNSAVAEDLVQETFLRVWNRVQAFAPERGALGPWVLTVARNRAIDYVRSVEGRNQPAALEIDRLEHPSLFRDFEADMMNAGRLRALAGAFGKLTDKQRTVIELAYYQGMSQTEIADRMQTPLGTVKTWARTALQLLRDEMSRVEAV